MLHGFVSRLDFQQRRDNLPKDQGYLPRGNGDIDRATWESEDVECGLQHFSIGQSTLEQQPSPEASAPEARERVDCGIQTEVT